MNRCHLRVKRCNLIGAEGKTRVSVSNRASFPFRSVYPRRARDMVRGSVSLQKHRDRVKSMGSANYLRRENFMNLIPQTSTNSRANTSYLGCYFSIYRCYAYGTIDQSTSHTRCQEKIGSMKLSSSTKG